jgi:hypothetical protein
MPSTWRKPEMDELYDAFEAFVTAFNESQATINLVLERQNAAAAALGAVVAALEALESEDEESEGEEAEEADDEPIYVAPPGMPPVNCYTCYAFGHQPDGSAFCNYWSQPQPPEVLAVGCPQWVLGQAAADAAEAEPEAEPEQEAPKSRGRRKPAPAPEPSAVTGQAKPKAPRGRPPKAKAAELPF